MYRPINTISKILKKISKCRYITTTTEGKILCSTGGGRARTYPTIDHHVDCVVIGAGGGGLRAAMGLTQNGFQTAVLTKVFPTRSHTVSAQGGLNAALGHMDDDCWLYHFYDTIKGSDWLGDQDAIHYLAKAAPAAVIELENFGLPFSRIKDGRIYQRGFGGQTLCYGEGGPARRTAACADRIGHTILHCLYGKSLNYNCRYFEEYHALDLLFDEGNCIGVIALCMEDGSLHRFHATNTILASGGCERCFLHCTTAHTTTGDGFAMISRAGLPLSDMEFVQFHPTGLHGSGILVTEGARGEGGYLVNGKGEKFMVKYSPKLKDLAPRDLVSRAMTSEIMEGRGCGPKKDHIELLLSHIDSNLLKERLPGILELVKTFTNRDGTKEPIPIVPTVHYNMGGIPTNWKSQVITRDKDDMEGTTDDIIIPGLWACGEVACTVHGANRLGGNSLLDIIVFGRAISNHITEMFTPGKYLRPMPAQCGDQSIARLDRTRNFDGDLTIHSVRNKMRLIMQKHCAVFRTGPLLDEGVELIEKLFCSAYNVHLKDRSLVWNSDLNDALELQNMMLCAAQILIGAHARKESRGAHSRTDFKVRVDEFDYTKPLEGQTRRPFTEHFRKHTLSWINPESGEVHLSYRPVVDKTLDQNEAPHVPPIPRIY